MVDHPKLRTSQDIGGKPRATPPWKRCGKQGAQECKPSNCFAARPFVNVKPVLTKTGSHFESHSEGVTRRVFTHFGMFIFVHCPLPLNSPDILLRKNALPKTRSMFQLSLQTKLADPTTQTPILSFNFCRRQHVRLRSGLVVMGGLSSTA